MLVSHRHRFIYTKTVKTGSTSVESYFEPLCTDDSEGQPVHYRNEYISRSGIIGFRGHDRPAECAWWNHMSASLIKQRLGEEIWSSYFKFCVVRNPYDKAISHFYFLRNERMIQVDDSLSEQDQFENWLLESGPPIDRDKYLIDDRICIDYFVRYERLRADLQQICARLGVSWEPDRLPTFKAGIRPSRASVDVLYTPKSQEIVRRAYAYELEYFGYSFPKHERGVANKPVRGVPAKGARP